MNDSMTNKRFLTVSPPSGGVTMQYIQLLFEVSSYVLSKGDLLYFDRVYA